MTCLKLLQSNSAKNNIFIGPIKLIQIARKDVIVKAIIQSMFRFLCLIMINLRKLMDVRSLKVVRLVWFKNVLMSWS